MKKGLLHLVKQRCKLNKTCYVVSSLNVECRTNRIFIAIARSWKVRFSLEISYYFEYLVLNYSTFYWFTELSKSNKTGFVLSSVYVELRTKRVVAIACQWKKSCFSYENFWLSRRNSVFDWVKGLSNMNQSWYGVSLWTHSETKFCIAFLGKNGFS